MIKTIDYEAKSTQEALDKAVAETGISLSDLKFEVLEAGGGGIFGITLKKSKIRVFLEEPDPIPEPDPEPTPEPAPEPAPEPTSEPQIEETSSAVEEKPEDEIKADSPTDQVPESAPAEEVVDEVSEPPSDEPPKSGWAQPSRSVKVPKKKTKKITADDLIKPAVPKDRVDIDLRDDGGPSRGRRGGGRRPGGRKGYDSDRRRSSGPRGRDGGHRSDRGSRRPRREEPRHAPQENFEPPKVARPISEYSDTPPPDISMEHLEIALKSLKEILSFWNPEAEVSGGFKGDKIFLDIQGDGSGLLIGRKGATLDALQFIVSKIVDRQAGKHLRLMVDTEGYRERREESLEQIASQLATKALRSGRSQMTNPLNPHDRRIVHLALQDDGRFKTRSRGDGTFKRVLISLKD